MSKVGFITGATRGIGKQIAITLAKQGYDIAINYREENEQLQETKKEIEALNAKCLAVKGDISHYEDCENMVKKVIEEFGKIDVLVNNAGITKDMLLLRMKEEDFRKVIDVNLIGTFNMCKNVTSYMMKERNGRIINISSVVGISVLVISYPSSFKVSYNSFAKSAPRWSAPINNFIFIPSFLFYYKLFSKT